MDEKALGKSLQLARRRAGLTQQELCQKAGLSYSTLAKIERGAIRSPSVFTVAAISGATNTPIEVLLNIQNQTLSSLAMPTPKKRAKSGVTFVYIDVNGTLVRFFHKTFVDIARESGEPADIIETLFWRHHDSIASGRISFEEFNSLLGDKLGVANFDYRKYYMANVEPMPRINELVQWLAQNYEIGILTNSFPGIIETLRERKIIPDAAFKTIIDSSKVGCVKPDAAIYQKAQELAAVEPREILLIDNERPNLKGAQAAGWQTFWFDETDPAQSITRAKAALEF